MNFSGFHQKRQNVPETKLHTCIFVECTSERKVLEHFTQKRHVVPYPCRESKCNDAFAISKILVAFQRSTIGRLYHRRDSRQVRDSIDEKRLVPSRFILFSLCLSGFTSYRNVISRVELTSRGAIAIGAGVHAILRVDLWIYRQQ